jgi:hypothetical protein
VIESNEGITVKSQTFSARPFIAMFPVLGWLQLRVMVDSSLTVFLGGVQARLNQMSKIITASMRNLRLEMFSVIIESNGSTDIILTMSFTNKRRDCIIHPLEH